MMIRSECGLLGLCWAKITYYIKPFMLFFVGKPFMLTRVSMGIEKDYNSDLLSLSLYRFSDLHAFSYKVLIILGAGLARFSLVTLRIIIYEYTLTDAYILCN